MASFPELTALVRNVVDSDPEDRDEQELNVGRLRELRDYASKTQARELAAALNAATRLVEVLASPVETLERGQVHSLVSRLLRSLAGEIEEARLTEPRTEAPSAGSVPEEPRDEDRDPRPVDLEPAAEEPVSAETAVASAPPELPTSKVRPTPTWGSFTATSGGRTVLGETPDEASVSERPAASLEAADTSTAPADDPCELDTDGASALDVPATSDDLDPAGEAVTLDTHEPSDRTAPSGSTGPTGPDEAPSSLNPELPETNDMVLGRMLVELGHASRKEVADGLRQHRQMGMPLGECLLMTGAVSPEKLLDTLRLQEKMRSMAHEVSLETVAEAERVREEVRAEEAKERQPAAAMRVTKDMFFGEVLLGAEMITNEELELAMRIHHLEGLRVGEALVKIGALNEAEVQEGLALQENLRYVAGLMKP